jgi:1-acyl-sn-glycerol-3-phosphate acyltransferase
MLRTSIKDGADGVLAESYSMSLWRSFLFYTVSTLFTMVLGAAAILAALVTRKSNASHILGRWWGNLTLWTAGVTVQVHGLEHIDPASSYVYAANHQSWFDIFAMLGKLPVQFRWLAKTELFKVFVLGRAMAAAGYIPIDRSNRRQAFESIKLAAQRVREGTSVVIFPEGTRSLDGKLQDFKKGGFILAIQSQHPIVPISISGTHTILPKTGQWRIHPGLVQMTIGRPISTEGLTAKDRDQLIEQVREAIRQHLTSEEGGYLPGQSRQPAQTDPNQGTA